MNTKFLKPSTGYPMADFQQNVMEIILNLSADLGSIDVANEALFRMFELSLPHATHQEITAFTKVQGAFRCINALARMEAETFNDLLEEQQSYKDDPVC